MTLDDRSPGTEHPLPASAADRTRLVSGGAAEYDVFVSYSRHDVGFARALDRALRRYHPPRRSGLRPGYLRVFRDESDLTGVEYGESIRRHLDAAANLVVICSPGARKSPRVAEEIDYFAASRGWNRVVPVLYAGLPNSGATPDGEDLKAFPEALMRSGREPLAVDYRDFTPGGDNIAGGRYFGSWCGLLANLYGVSRTVIEQRENRRRLARLRMIGAAVSSVVVVLSVALLVTLRSRAEARTQRDRAVTTIGRILTQRAWQALDAGDRHLAAQYALSGLRAAPMTAGGQRVILASIIQEAGEGRVLTEDSTTGLGVAINPAGNLLATTGDHGDVRLWDLPSGRLIGRFSGHLLRTTQAVFTADGAAVLSSSEDGTVRVWRVSDQMPLGPDLEPGSSVDRIALSPDGRYVVAASDPVAGSFDGVAALSLWRLTGGPPVWNVTLPGRVLALSFTADGNSIATVDGAGQVELRYVDTGARYSVRALPDGERLTAAAIAPEHDLIAIGFGDGTVQRLQLSGAIPVSSTKGHEGAVRVVAIAPSGRTFASGGSDGVARVWSVVGGHDLGMFAGHRGAVTSVSYGPGDVLLTAGADSSIRIWSKGRVTPLPSRWAQTAAVATVDSSILIVGGGDTLFVCELPKCSRSIAVPWPTSVDFAASRANDVTQVTSIDSVGRVISGSVPGPPPVAGRELGKGLFASALSPDGSLAAITTFDQPTTVSIVDIMSGATTLLPGAAGTVVHRVAFSRDGTRLVAASQGGWLSIWNVADRTVVKVFNEAPPVSGQVMFSLYGGALRDVALNQDGSFLAWLFADGTAYVHDIRADRRVAVLGPSAVEPHTIAISDDAQLIALAGPFGGEIWERSSGHRVARFGKPTGQVMFTPDGRHVVAGATKFVWRDATAAGENPLLTELWDIERLSSTTPELESVVCTHFLTWSLHWFSDRAVAADPLIEEVLPAREQTQRTLCPGNQQQTVQGGSS